MSSSFLTAEWRKLLMAQYAVDPATLAPYLPAGATLDLFRGRCCVSLVGFLFDNVRVKRFSIPFHKRFEEVNLRFYVKRTEPNGAVRRGVVFIREFVPRFAIAFVANTFYEEPYATLPMRHKIEHNPASLSVEYNWRHLGTWHSMSATASSQSLLIAPDSEEEFITEHYWGFTKRSSGSASQYEVRHPRWQVYPILRSAIHVDFGALYGPAFAELTGQQPASILLAEGSPVSVHTGSRLPA